MTLVAYFDQPARALVGPQAAIPSAAVFGRVPDRRPQELRAVHRRRRSRPARDGRARPAAPWCSLRRPISDANALGGRSDDLQVRIDLTGAPELPAGSYTGTLNLLVITQ